MSVTDEDRAVDWDAKFKELDAAIERRVEAARAAGYRRGIEAALEEVRVEHRSPSTFGEPLQRYLAAIRALLTADKEPGTGEDS